MKIEAYDYEHPINYVIHVHNDMVGRMQEAENKAQAMCPDYFFGNMASDPKSSLSNEDRITFEKLLTRYSALHETAQNSREAIWAMMSWFGES